MTFDLSQFANSTFEFVPMDQKHLYVPIDVCKSYVETTQTMNTVYLVLGACILFLCFFIMWKAGWFDDDTD